VHWQLSPVNCVSKFFLRPAGVHVHPVHPLATPMWTDFYKAWHKYSPCELALLLKRFSRSEVKGQGHMCRLYKCVNAITAEECISTVWHRGSLLFLLFCSLRVLLFLLTYINLLCSSATLDLTWAVVQGRSRLKRYRILHKISDTRQNNTTAIITGIQQTVKVSICIQLSIYEWENFAHTQRVFLRESVNSSAVF